MNLENYLTTNKINELGSIIPNFEELKDMLEVLKLRFYNVDLMVDTLYADNKLKSVIKYYGIKNKTKIIAYKNLLSSIGNGINVVTTRTLTNTDNNRYNTGFVGFSATNQNGQYTNDTETNNTNTNEVIKVGNLSDEIKYLQDIKNDLIEELYNELYKCLFTYILEVGVYI